MKIIKKLSTLSILSIPILFIFLLLFQKDLALTEDLGRHIILEKIILQCHCMPSTNLFSFVEPNYPWVDNSWLSQVIFYLLFVKFGLNSLLVLKTILIISTFLFLYIPLVRKKSLFWTIMFSILTFAVFFDRFQFRPELFSFLFIAIFLYVIDRFKEKRYYPILYILPILELLWVNLHIFFVFGIVIYGFFLIDQLIQERGNIDRRLFLILLPLIAATFITPYFFSGTFLPFTILTNYAWRVQELESPFFYFANYGTSLPYNVLIPIVFFEILAPTLLISFIPMGKKIKFYFLFLSLFAIGFALKMIRTFPIFAILAFAPLVENFTYIEKKLDKSILLLFRATAIIITLFMLVFMINKTAVGSMFGFEFLSYADNALNFFNNAHIKGPIFNDLDYGGYLIFRLYPKEKIFIDSRPEAYSTQTIQKYLKMITSDKYFNSEAEKYHINSVIFTTQFLPKNSLVVQLLKDNKWVPVYVDNWMIIFVKNSLENQGIINKYAVHKKIVIE